MMTKNKKLRRCVSADHLTTKTTGSRKGSGKSKMICRYSLSSSLVRSTSLTSIRSSASSTCRETASNHSPPPPQLASVLSIPPAIPDEIDFTTVLAPKRAKKRILSLSGSASGRLMLAPAQRALPSGHSTIYERHRIFQKGIAQQLPSSSNFFNSSLSQPSRRILSVEAVPPLPRLSTKSILKKAGTSTLSSSSSATL